MLMKIFSFLKSLIKKICLVFGALTIVALIVGIFVIFGNNQSTEIKNNSYLEIDLSENYAENSQTSLLDDFIGYEKPSFLQLIKCIEFASVDSKIKGLVVKADALTIDLAQTQELSNVMEKFKKTGKKIYVFSRGFGNLGRGNREYYIASFADKIYMQPHSFIGLTGISIEVPFIKKALSKIGVEPEFYSRYEYKTAMAFVTDDKMTSYYREELGGLANGIMNELENKISENRKLKNIKDLVNNAPLSAEQGLKFGMIDGLMYQQEFENLLKKEGMKEKVNGSDYALMIQNNRGDLPTIALLTLDGVINAGKETEDVSGETAIYSEDALEQIKEISKLPLLKSVIVRINSPGGEYGAADEIYFALQNLKKKRNVPIIVSQGGYAASGGYFISLAGDVIITHNNRLNRSFRRKVCSCRFI